MEKEGTGTTYKIQAGDAYVFDDHESHYIRGGPDGAKIICIFTPACTGKEVSIVLVFQNLMTNWCPTLKVSCFLLYLI